MPASVVTVEIHLPAARSLKDKRRIVKSLKDKIFDRYRASIAEIGNSERRQSATLGIAVVAPSPAHLADIMGSLRSIIDQRPDLIVTRWDERTAELAP